MERIYRLVSSTKPGRYWFVGKDANDIWVWDRENQEGICGDEKTFQIGQGEQAAVTVRGPWCSNEDALYAETGKRLSDLT